MNDFVLSKKMRTLQCSPCSVNRLLWVLGLSIVFAHWLPYIILGQDSYVLIHDYLDSTFVTAKVLADSGQLFAASASQIDQYDLPRMVLLGEFYLPAILDTVMSPFVTHVVCDLFMRVVAFSGMYVLLKRHILGEREAWISCGVAVCFALLPFWPGAVLSIAGLPLVLYAFLNLREGSSAPKDWGIVVLFPFFSGLLFIGIFFLALLAGVFLFDLLVTRRSNIRFLCGIVMMSIVYLCVEYRLVINTLTPLFVPHRSDNHPAYVSLASGLHTAWENFLYGQYHVPTLHKFVILPVAIAGVAVTMGQRAFRDRQLWLLVGILAFSGLVSLWYGLWKSVAMETFRKTIPLLEAVSLSRFHCLHPLLWYLAFALALLLLRRYIPIRRLGLGLVALALVWQAYLVGYKNHPIRTEQALNGITYRQFFSEDLFAKIKADIGAPVDTYRVVSLGLHPSIAAYNGFRTVDWYLAYYPLSKKQEFRTVIARELSKSPSLTRYFDGWGNRLYLFSDALGQDFLGRKNRGPIEMPDFDLDVLREKGVKYMISRVEILNGPRLLHLYPNPDGPWDIYVYVL